MQPEVEALIMLTSAKLARKPIAPELVAAQVASVAESALQALQVPAYATGGHGDGRTLLPCGGAALERSRRPGPKPRQEESDYLAWCARDRAHAAIVRALRARLTVVLGAVGDLENLQRDHPEAAKTLPQHTARLLGQALEVFGAEECTARTPSAIWAYARAWPGARRAEQPWQDVGGWGE